MDITKCDKCKKVKDGKNRSKWMDISISGGDFSYKNFDFCEKCGDKIIKRVLKIINLTK